MAVRCCQTEIAHLGLVRAPVEEFCQGFATKRGAGPVGASFACGFLGAQRRGFEDRGVAKIFAKLNLS